MPGAVIMVGGAGPSTQEQIVNRAQRASTLDLVAMLRASGISRIVVAAPTTDWLPPDLDLICVDDPTTEPFHFGRRLATLAESYGCDPLLYFGGGSAPLLDASTAGLVVGLLNNAVAGRGKRDGGGIPTHIVLSNNLHSSDWAAITQVATALPVIEAQDRDNSLAWALRESGNYDVRVVAAVRPAASLDIDTPTDLAILARHHDTQPALKALLAPGAEIAALLQSVPLDSVLDICSQEAKTVALIGRVSPAAWQALNTAARIWTRVIAEERGMVASARFDRGEVRSVLVPWISARGLDGFFADLSTMADAALFDNRVLIAALGHHPDAADRFASDLFMVDAVRDPWLREFTAAAARSPIPIIVGGHSVVAGGLHALAEILRAR